MSFPNGSYYSKLALETLELYAFVLDLELLELDACVGMTLKGTLLLVFPRIFALEIILSCF